MERRTFIKQSVLLGSSILVYNSCYKKPDYPEIKGTVLKQNDLLHGLKEVTGPEYLPQAEWYEGYHPGDGISYSFPAGTLANMNYIAADMLADGNHMTRFQIALKEGEFKLKVINIKGEFHVQRQCKDKKWRAYNKINGSLYEIFKKINAK